VIWLRELLIRVLLETLGWLLDSILTLVLISMLLLKVVGNVKLTGTGTGYEVFSVAGDVTDYKASSFRF
jgi:hypothetical protein